MRTISDKRRRILEFLRQFLDERGYPPTIRDIQAGLGISSTSVVDHHLRVLERDGYIRRFPDISRGTQLLYPGRRQVVSVPVMGLIAAGEPIPVPSSDSWHAEAIESVDVVEEMIGGKEGVYALKVKGSSMVDALIGDGDIVLMQHANTAENGEMVAIWLKGEEEVTLKRFYPEGGRIRLQPANTQMEPIYADHDNVQIQGRVIGVIRRL